MDKINRQSHVSQSEDEYIKLVSDSWILVCILSKNIRKKMIDTPVKFTQKSRNFSIDLRNNTTEISKPDVE